MNNFTLTQQNQLVEKLAQLLLEKKSSVATVESCTGGGIAYALTEVAGSSRWFSQSWVTYSNEAKHNLVGVKKETLEQFGAVSTQVVVEMANKGARLSGAGLCLAVSGIAGPGGATTNKPVGMVCFAIAGSEVRHTIHFTENFNGTRAQVRKKAICFAIEKLIECLAD